MTPWQPATEFENRLHEALLTDDVETSLQLLLQTQLLCPVSSQAATGDAPYQWPTVVVEGRTWICAFTSHESMVGASGGAVTHSRITSAAELAAGWPDPTWGLVLNPGLPAQMYLESGTLARLVSPSLSDLRAEGLESSLLLQKVLTNADTEALLDNDLATISGYVHFAADVDEIRKPETLLRALGLDPTHHLRDDGSLFLLRWTPICLDFYLPSYGGTTAEARDAVHGQIIERPPYVGLGLGRNRDATIREHKAQRAPLPSGTQWWRLSREGAWSRLGSLNLRRARWQLAGGADDYADDDAPLNSLELESLASTGTMVDTAGAYVVIFGGDRFSAVPRLHEQRGWVFELIEQDAEQQRAVEMQACDVVHYERTVCLWQGAECAVAADHGEQLLVEYLGTDADAAERFGWSAQEQGVYRSVISRDDARSMRQHILPLWLADD